MFHHTELSICFTAQIAHHHAYVYIYALFHHTELTSVLPHRWPSFATLEKPTIWVVTYLSPSYTPICTHIHTYILFVLQISHYHTYVYIYTLFHHTELSTCFTAQISHYHTYIYIHIYSVSPHRVNICFSTQRPSFTAQLAHYHIYTYTYIHIHIYSVSQHRVDICFSTQMAQFYHTRETNNLDGDLSITISHTHMYTHIHTNVLFVLQIAHHHPYIYVCIYLFHHTELSICLTAQIAHHHVCIYIYIHTLFHHTELTSVLPHRWPSFTTLGKPTIWMVTYLSPSYIHAYVHTYTVCFTDITSYYIYIYTLFRHTELSICFTVQISHHHIYIYYI